jgi:hypothetical protein
MQVRWSCFVPRSAISIGYLNNTHQNNVSYVQVSYSSASAGVEIDATDGGVDLGNNHNWAFTVIAPTGTITWTGTTDTDWNTATNWDLGRTPFTGDDVVIPNTGNKPIINNQITINSLNISEGNAALDLNNYNLTVSTYITLVGTLTARGNEQITLGGNWNNTSGWFNAANSTVTFNAATGWQSVISGGTDMGKQFNHFRFTGTGSTLTLSGYDLYVSSKMTLATGANIFDNSVSSRNITVGDDFTMAAVRFHMGRATWTFFGGYTNMVGDSLVHNNSTAVFKGINKKFNNTNPMGSFYTVQFEGNTDASEGQKYINGNVIVIGTVTAGIMSLQSGGPGSLAVKSSGVLKGFDSSSVISVTGVFGISELSGRLTDIKLDFRRTTGIIAPALYESSTVTFFNDSTYEDVTTTLSWKPALIRLRAW